MKQTACIIGGSGFVGRAVARQAIEAGHRVIIACRHPERARPMRQAGIRLHKADIASGEGLDAAVAGADCVVNLVGLLHERGNRNFHAVHVRGVEHTLAACARAGVVRYLHMSALGADLGSLSRYARSKAEAEQRVRQSRLNWTIFRPSVIYGVGDSFFHRFRRMYAHLPVAPLIGARTRFQPIWVGDVARALVCAMDWRQADGCILELGGPGIHTLEELIRMLLRELGWKRPILPLPAFAATLLARLLQFLPTPPITPDQLLLLKKDNIVNGEAFPSAFGRAADLERMLPLILRPDPAALRQQRLDRERRRRIAL